MTAVREERIVLGGAEEKLIEKQALLEKQKLEYDETVIKKDHVITEVSLKNMCILYFILMTAT